MGDYVNLERSYEEVELRLHSTVTNGIVQDANSASDNNNTKFTYDTNNLGHTLFKEMNLYLNGIVMSAQTNTYAYHAFFETLLNYNRDERETLLAPRGWVNYFNVGEVLAKTANDDDQITTVGWRHNKTTPLKTATKPFYGNKLMVMHVRPHLDAFRIARFLVPWVEINLGLFCNTPEFFLFRSKPTVKLGVTLKADKLKVNLYLSRVALNDNVYNTLKEIGKLMANRPGTLWSTA